jgi:hypothetical protein
VSSAASHLNFSPKSRPRRRKVYASGLEGIKGVPQDNQEQSNAKALCQPRPGAAKKANEL